MNTLFALGSFLGIFIAFGLGCIGTSRLLKFIAEGRIGVTGKANSFFTRRNIGIFIGVGGVITSFLYALLLIRLPMECFTPILVVVLFSGFYAIFFNIITKKPSQTPLKKSVPVPVTSQNVTGSIEDLHSNLEILTKSPTWEWWRFRSVLIYLARIGQGCYIPANRRPDQISLDGLGATFTELRQISNSSNGRETSRAVFVDKEMSCLVISGKTHIGTIKSVKIDMETQPRRQYAQLPVLTIHVHPSMGSPEGFSDIDYTSFLSDNRLIVMVICYEGGVFLALKTSATSKNITASTAQHMISTIRHDILRIWSNLNIPNSILAFNKAVCMEFGMTLYKTTGPDNNVAYRIEVTSL